MKLFHEHDAESDVILVGGWIMSATLWIFLKILNPKLQIHIFEKRDEVGFESSDALNNAWTWHSALCELNYTPLVDGKIDTTKADEIIEKFETSKQFRSHLVENNYFPNGNEFINRVPHMSLVFGEKNCSFLEKRYQALTENPLFKEMEFSTDPELLLKWFPLMMKGRDKDTKVAATRSEIWTDVNFWMLTRDMFSYLNEDDHVHIHRHQEITDLNKTKDWHRELTIKDHLWAGKNTRKMTAAFVFLGSGGMAIPLLAKSWVEWGKNYGGFPVDGQWLICNNPEVVKKHHGKVYGQASVGSPPMSVPHLDTRVIDGKRSLLFGPYAWFTTKFLKQGKWYDLFSSLHLKNIWPMMQVWLNNWSLTKYLIWQIVQWKDDRMASLREYYPEAKDEDRYREYAGKRVQIIKNDPDKWWVLQFWTEVFVSKDKSLSALLWASPWASTSVSIILELIQTAFPEQIQSEERISTLKKVIPSYGKSLRENIELAEKIRNHTHSTLWLNQEDFQKKDHGFYE